MPADKKIIAVACASKRQSLSLIRAIVDEGDNCEFKIRALTQESPSHPIVLWMREMGVDVRYVNMDDEYELVKTLDGVHGFFATTAFWEDPEIALRHARLMAAAAKMANVKHIVWSTLEDTRMVMNKEGVPTLMDRYNVPHFDVKGESEKYFASASIPMTYVMTSCLWESFIDCGLEPKKSPDGSWVMSLPMGTKRLAGMASEDIGKCLLAIFRRPTEYVNKRVGLVGEILTMDQIAEKMSMALNKDIRYKEISFDDYSKLNQPSCMEIANMFRFYHDHEELVLNNRSIEESKKLNPKMMTFGQWLERYKHLIPMSA